MPASLRADLHVRTPLIPSTALGRIVGRPVYLKLENTQPTASFKLRGIGRLCANAAAAGATSIVSSSGGNAGWAAAYAARKLGLRAHVVIPRPTPAAMVALIQAEGAEVIVHGESWVDADQRARAIVEREGATYVSPFDHPDIWAGHSTLVDEIADEIEPPGCIVASVSGGGLLAGVLEGLARQRWSDTFVIGAQAAGAAALSAAMAAGRPVKLDRADTVARTLRATQVAQGTFDRLDGHDVRPRPATDLAAVRACRRFVDDHRMVVEPACGVALAAVYDRAPELLAARSIVVVICGGAGITVAELDEHLARLEAGEVTHPAAVTDRAG
jgi:L-serine/L-threonine ammonia-lyase